MIFGFVYGVFKLQIVARQIIQGFFWLNDVFVALSLLMNFKSQFLICFR